MAHAGRLRRLILVGILSLCTAACASISTVKDAPLDEGISKTFNAPYDKTVAATAQALSSLNVGATKSSENSEGTVYLVHKAVSAFSWGEVGRVYIKKGDDNSTTVYVDWKKRYQLQISGTDEDEFSEDLFSGIAKNL